MALFSTAYLPPVSYMACLVQHSGGTIEAYESYFKQTYRNRAIIMTANGPLPLTIPVLHPKGAHCLTKDVAISNQENWAIRHWRAIESAYSAAPYFQYYCDGLQKIILSRPESLMDFNQALMQQILQWLKVPYVTSRSNDFTIPNQGNDDFRYTFSPKHTAPIEKWEEYYQVFNSKFPFTPDLSIIDLIFNMGPESTSYLQRVKFLNKAN